MCTVDSGSVKPRQSHKTIWCTCFFYKHDVYKNILQAWWFFKHMFKHYAKPWYFHKIVWWFYFNEISICCVFASLPVYCNLPVYQLWRFLATSLFIAPSPFIILAEICQPPRLFRPPLLFETREYLVNFLVLTNKVANSRHN